MSIATYAELQTAVAGWINRTDLTAVIPDFITLAEASIRRDIRARDQLTLLTVTLTSEEATLPADFLEARYVKAEVNGFLQTLEYVAETVYDNQPDAAQATFYTVDGNTLKIQGGSDVLLSYYAKYDPLATTATNWLLTNSPDVYLFACLVEAYDYIRDDAGRDRCLDRYKRGAMEFNANEQKALHAGPMRVRAA